MKAVVATFNQEKTLVGAFSVLTNLRMELFQALVRMLDTLQAIISCLMSSSNSCPNSSRRVLQIPRSVVSSSSITVFSLARGT